MKDRRYRYSLGGAMLLITIGTLALGYVQSLRFDVRRERAALEKLGVRFSERAGWLGIPDGALVPCIGNPRCGEIIDRLMRMGMEEGSIELK